MSNDNEPKKPIHHRDLPLETHAAVANLKDQLILVLMRRLGGKLTIPVAEIDGTENDLLNVEVNHATGEFHFELASKS